MKRALAVYVIALGTAMAGAAFFTFRAPVEPPKKLAGSTVKVVLNEAHGSGVHIGNGFVVTAAHVVGDAGTAELKLDDGSTAFADVLWVNKAYDLALLKTDARPKVSVLACEAQAVGTQVRAIGNPINLDFIVSYGRIASDAKERGIWKEVLIVDITVAPGVSGGPLLDARGMVVGIAVGMAAASVGFFPTPVPYTYAVPSSAVCKMMARA
jgi:S1-C subfamily serine protease